jgi:hypothetical protein
MTRSVILVGLAIVAVAAQDKPDFSGSWLLSSSEVPRSDIPRALLVRQPLVRTNVHGESMRPFYLNIAVDREFASGTRSQTYMIGVVGGVVPGLTRDGTPRGSTEHHAVTWDENTLVFETGTYTGSARETGAWAERREVWSLDPDGRLRVVITTRNSVDTPSTVSLVYRPR